MPHDVKAVIFDLDDTLYPLQRFVHSGFRAVAAHLAERFRVDRREALAVLGRASRGATKGRELQACVTYFGLSPALIPELIHVIRLHRPSLRLPRASRLALTALRADYRLGIVTNGLPDLQARKIDGLGLRFLVDTVVYANELSGGRGKPEREAFLVAAQRLNVPPSSAIFVGDDARCDIFGASRVGMKTIHVTRHRRAAVRACFADATASTLAQVPAIVSKLGGDARWSSHVA